MQYFFVDDPEYFDRDQLYGTAQGDYPDNAERFAEFSRAAIEVAAHVWKPDVIHCHDWQSALVPVLLRTQHEDDPELRAIPVVLTIHNMGYQGVFPPRGHGTRRPSGVALRLEWLGILRPGELPQGRPALCRLL